MKSLDLKKKLSDLFEFIWLPAALVLIAFLTASPFQAKAESEGSGPAEESEVEQILGEDIPRNVRAMWALELTGERAIPGDFRFPDHADPAYIYGLDVSRYQGRIKWEFIPINRVIFSIAKATQGTTWVDPRFQSNWSQLASLRDEAMQDGNPNFFRGAYHFFSPKRDPVEQAEHFIQAVGELEPGDLPPTLDVEWDLDCSPCKSQNKRCAPSCAKDRWDEISRKERISRVKTWLETVERSLGRTPIIYTNRYWWQDKFGHAPEVAPYPLWIADYSSRSRNREEPAQLPPGFETWTLWQFTDRGVIQGIKGRVDVNRFNGSLYHVAKLATSEPRLAQGSVGPEVEQIQDVLVDLGYMSAQEKSTGPGIFGPRTEAALKAFQRDNGLMDHGVVDEETKSALDNLGTGLRQGDSSRLVPKINKHLKDLSYFQNRSVGEAEDFRFIRLKCFGSA